MSEPGALRHSERFRSELLRARRILCVQPHYDDNDIAAGGTFALLADAGTEIHYLTVTDSLAGVKDPDLPDAETAALLRAEQARAGREIGVSAWHWLDLPDAGEWSEVTLRTGILRHIRALRPDYVFSCDPWLPHEAHRDHLRTGIAAAEAVMFHPLPRFKTSPDVDAAYFGDSQRDTLRALVLYYTLEPNLLFDIAPTRARKHRAMDSYRLQIAGEALSNLHRGIEAAERQFASGQPFEHAEAFKLLRPAELHVGLARRR